MSTPRFTWSHSAIEDYKNCPLSYAHKRYYKDVEVEQAEHLDWGNRVHKALELAVTGEPQIEGGDEIVAMYQKYVDAILQAAEGGELLTEYQMCINEAMEPVDWFAEDAWGRGIIDVCVVKGDTAWIFDYKTGKVRDSDAQLKLFCAFLSLHYPKVERFIPRFIWLKDGVVTPKGYMITKAQIPQIWSDVLAQVRRMKMAWDDEVFPARPSGLCPWCAYKTCLYKKTR